MTRYVTPEDLARSMAPDRRRSTRSNPLARFITRGRISSKFPAANVTIHDKQTGRSESYWIIEGTRVPDVEAAAAKLNAIREPA